MASYINVWAWELTSMLVKRMLKMKRNQILLILTFYSLFILEELKSSLATQPGNDNQVYIVYMGGADSTNGSLRKDHAHVLNMVLRR